MIHKKFLYINLLISNIALADELFSKCSESTEAKKSCMTNISELHPGQSNVGLFVINMKKPENGVFSSIQKKCENNTLNDSLLKKCASKKGISGVIGPNGKIYLIDGHHSTYSLYLLANQANKCNYAGEVCVYIEDNKKDLIESQFVSYMKQQQYVWLKDKTGRNIEFSALPDKISKIGDDPYRSLIKLIADSKCNQNNPVIDSSNNTPYLEFYWSNKLELFCSNLYNLNQKNANIYTRDAYNYMIQHQDYFKDLPGFIPADKKELCKKVF